MPILSKFEQLYFNLKAMLALKGTYENGMVILEKPFPSDKKIDVIVTFLEEDRPKDAIALENFSFKKTFLGLIKNLRWLMFGASKEDIIHAIVIKITNFHSRASVRNLVWYKLLPVKVNIIILLMLVIESRKRIYFSKPG